MVNIEVKYIVLGCVLLTASIYDIRWRRIPNWLTFSTFGAALVYQSTTGGMEGFFFGLQGAGVGIGALLLFYALGGMGAGDVKLLGAVGAFLGPEGVFNTFLFTALLGGFYAVAVLAFTGELLQVLKRYWAMLLAFMLTKRIVDIPSPVNQHAPKLCYGVVIALGTVSYLAVGGIV